MTGLPLLGLTYATGDDSYSARIWDRAGPRQYAPVWCENVRLVGDRIQVTWNDRLRPVPRFRPCRTVPSPPGDRRSRLTWPGCTSGSSARAASARSSPRPWPGSASSGSPLLDFDTVEAVNLDRLLHAEPRDARLARAKVEILARALRRSATAEYGPGSRRSSCPSPNRPALPPRWTATCCSAASTGPGPARCSTSPPTPTWSPSSTAGSSSAAARPAAGRRRMARPPSRARPGLPRMPRPVRPGHRRRSNAPACSTTRPTSPASTTTTPAPQRERLPVLRRRSRQRDAPAPHRRHRARRHRRHRRPPVPLRHRHPRPPDRRLPPRMPLHRNAHRTRRHAAFRRYRGTRRRGRSSRRPAQSP